MKKKVSSVPQKTLAERIGEKNVTPFLEHLYHERSFTEIAKRMPKIFATKGQVAGVRHRWRLEIDTKLTALLVSHGPPAEKGRSKPFTGTKPVEEVLPPPPKQPKHRPMAGLTPLAEQLLALTDKHCHQVEGNRYCGRSGARMWGGAGPYCEEHKPLVPTRR